jgi:regulator of replication initiation timing
MRARRREINIFNMSLLDILCGALGAFCFMMLVALPYYKPPGSEKSLRDAQAETQRLLRDLEAMKLRMSDPKAVAEMEDLIRRLEAQIKALQGHVNILSSEKEQLTGQVNQLTALVKRLGTQNEQLDQENQALKKQIAQMHELTPVLVQVYTDGNQAVDLYAYIVNANTRNAGETNPPFDPSKQWNGTYWQGDSRLVAPQHGVTAWMMRDLPPGTVVKLYAKVNAIDIFGAPAHIAGTIAGSGSTEMKLDDGSVVRTAYNPIKLPTVELTPSRPWILFGTLTSHTLGKIDFTAATETERDAEWKTLSKSTPRAPATPALSPTR